MVIKTETCFFTEFKIYPGRGCQFVRKDGKLLTFINQKSRSLYFQKRKAQKLTWTQQWRRRHKKGKVGVQQKKKTKRAAKVYKAIQGLDIDLLRKRRTLKPDARKAAREANLRELKERKRKDAADKKKKKQTFRKPAAFTKVPKSRRKAGMGGAKSTGR